jgi:hypothetical protein
MEVNKKPHDISTRPGYYTMRLLSTRPPPSVAWPQHIRESVTRLPLCADKLRLSSAMCRSGLGPLMPEVDAFCVDPSSMKVRLRRSAE